VISFAKTIYTEYTHYSETTAGDIWHRNCIGVHAESVDGRMFGRYMRQARD